MMLSTVSGTQVAGALIGAAIALTVVGPASAAGQDMRSPDAVDAGEQPAPTDARGVTNYPTMPDARDTTQPASPSEDRRSADSRAIQAPAFDSQPVAYTRPSPGGLDLVSAAIGTAAGTGLPIALAAFVAMRGLTVHGRHGTQRA